MRVACIDIGSNTTRLLVADVDGDRVEPVEQRRVFTHLRRQARPQGKIAPAVIAQQVDVVAQQLTLGQSLGAERVTVVATAAVRRTGPESQDALARALRQRCGAALCVLDEADEARLAFAGACAALGRKASATRAQVPTGELGVVDVGGGSSELVIGTAPDRVRWSCSCALGSGDLVDAWLPSDPPAREELARAREHVAGALAAVPGPPPAQAVAVGGSAASLQPLAGPSLDGQAFAAALEVLLAAPAAEVAGRYGLDEERVRLLPGGVLILQAAQERFGVPLRVVAGGLREGVLMELAATAGGAGNGVGGG